MRPINFMEFKYKFLRWLSRRVFKTPEGQKHNRFVNFVYILLCPLHYSYSKQSFIKYDINNDTYLIHGVLYSRTALHHFGVLYADGLEIVTYMEYEKKQVVVKGVTKEFK